MDTTPPDAPGTGQPHAGTREGATAFRLRPLGVGDLVDETINLLRANFVVLAVLAGAPTIAATVVLLVVAAAVGVAAFGSVMMQLMTGGVEALNPALLGNIIGSLIAFGLFAIVILIVANALATGGVTYAVSQLYLGRRVTIAEAYQAVVPRLLALILAPMIVTVLALIIIAAVALVFGGIGAAANFSALAACGFVLVGLPLLIFLSIKFCVINPAIVVEGLGPVGGIARSWGLVSDHFWRVFLIWLVFLALAIVIFLIQGLVSGIFGGILSGAAVAQVVVEQVVSLFFQIVLTLLGIIVATLIYYDLRVRKEGFDLETMANQLGARASGPGPATPPMPPY